MTPEKHAKAFAAALSEFSYVLAHHDTIAALRRVTAPSPWGAGDVKLIANRYVDRGEFLTVSPAPDLIPVAGINVAR